MNTSQNVITIEPTGEDGRTGSIMFRAPADIRAARSVWVFLVENLQPGFMVELSTNSSELSQASGKPVPPELYAQVMANEHL